ncbi:hypothetical protein BPTFM16_01810 [Altererythrobacter insulae]|nr:hypothetical protein BPTFM16_01810 [Altererythrobacter insulae]
MEKRPEQLGQEVNQTPFRIIIPAHNEEAVIARCLCGIIEDCPADAGVEIVVVANGCDDRTAEIARSFVGPVRVEETQIASKTSAINLGMSDAQALPCLVMDADVEASFGALHATALAVSGPEVTAASPALAIDFEGVSSWVRSYYDVWRSLPYARARLIGGGVYGLSAEAVEALSPFPDLIADDLFVRTQVPFSRRQTVHHTLDGNRAKVTMFPPQTVRELVSIEARRRRGTKQLKQHLGKGAQVEGNGVGSLLRELGKSFGFTDLLRYAAVKLAGRLLALAHRAFGREHWDKDLSSRDAR